MPTYCADAFEITEPRVGEQERNRQKPEQREPRERARAAMERTAGGSTGM